MGYLKERKTEAYDSQSTHHSFYSINNTFERALGSLSKMPRIWLEYLDFLVNQNLITITRRAFNRALQALPTTQHDRIWPLYLKFLHRPGIPLETICSVYQRYILYAPNGIEEYVTLLKNSRLYHKAVQKLSELVNNKTFRLKG